MIAAVLLLLVATPDLDKLAAEYFKADAARRTAILGEIEPSDRIEPKDIAPWQEKLLKLAAENGRKVKKSGTDYWYDRDQKRGKYMVGGSGGRAAS